MTQPNVDPQEPIGWRAVTLGTPVRSCEGEQVGVVLDVLGSDEEDVFHGIVAVLQQWGRRVLVLADDVSLLTPSHVDVDLTVPELPALPDHTDALEFELGWTGLVRKHLGWVEDKDR